MDYSIKVMHDYAIGTFEQIKKGTGVPKTLDLAATKSSFQEQNGKSSSILVPHLIGAYRRVNIAFNPDGNGEPLERRIDYSDKSLFDVHPSLVQIGYDPSVINLTVISDFIGVESARMLIVPYQDLVLTGSELEELSRLTAQRFENQAKGQKITREEWNRYFGLLRPVLKTAGLTKRDYDLLNSSSGAVIL